MRAVLATGAKRSKAKSLLLRFLSAGLRNRNVEAIASRIVKIDRVFQENVIRNERPPTDVVDNAAGQHCTEQGQRPRPEKCYQSADRQYPPQGITCSKPDREELLVDQSLGRPKKREDRQAAHGAALGLRLRLRATGACLL